MLNKNEGDARFQGGFTLLMGMLTVKPLRMSVSELFENKSWVFK